MFSLESRLDVCAGSVRPGREQMGIKHIRIHTDSDRIHWVRAIFAATFGSSVDFRQKTNPRRVTVILSPRHRRLRLRRRTEWKL